MLESLKGAVSFLTVFRLNVKHFDAKEVLRFFPLVGLLIGTFIWLVGLVFSPVAPVMMLMESVIITGGLHLDGLADMADGYFSGKSREKMLEIMKDSRVGTMGVLALVTVLLAKFYCFGRISSSWLLVALPFAYSRNSMLYLIKNLSYAREEGTGKVFFCKLDKKDFLIGYAICILPLLKGGVFFIVYNLVYFTLVNFFIWYHKNKIGGGTGDILGATSELIETTLLLVGVYFA